jgi:hypothetical protein
MLDESRLEQLVREAMLKVVGQARPLPVRQSAPTYATLGAAGGNTVTEVLVQPSGAIQIRVGEPEALARMSAAAPGNGAPSQVPTPAPTPAPATWDTGPTPGCCDVACIDPWGFSDFGQRMEAPYFSVDEEHLIGNLLQSTAMSRQQLMGHLLHRVLADEARVFAEEQQV